MYQRDGNNAKCEKVKASRRGRIAHNHYNVPGLPKLWINQVARSTRDKHSLSTSWCFLSSHAVNGCYDQGDKSVLRKMVKGLQKGTPFWKFLLSFTNFVTNLPFAAVVLAWNLYNQGIERWTERLSRPNPMDQESFKASHREHLKKGNRGKW